VPDYWPRPVFAKCRHPNFDLCEFNGQKLPPGLGDIVESALSSIGITQAAWVEWKKEHGLPPTCSCSARKEWLNRFGERFGKAAKAAASILYR